MVQVNLWELISVAVTLIAAIGVTAWVVINTMTGIVRKYYDEVQLVKGYLLNFEGRITKLEVLRDRD